MSYVDGDDLAISRQCSQVQSYNATQQTQRTNGALDFLVVPISIKQKNDELETNQDGQTPRSSQFGVEQSHQNQCEFKKSYYKYETQERESINYAISQHNQDEDDFEAKNNNYSTGPQSTRLEVLVQDESDSIKYIASDGQDEINYQMKSENDNEVGGEEHSQNLEGGQNLEEGELLGEINLNQTVVKAIHHQKLQQPADGSPQFSFQNAHNHSLAQKHCQNSFLSGQTLQQGEADPKFQKAVQIFIQQSLRMEGIVDMKKRQASPVADQSQKVAQNLINNQQQQDVEQVSFSQPDMLFKESKQSFDRAVPDSNFQIYMLFVPKVEQPQTSIL